MGTLGGKGLILNCDARPPPPPSTSSPNNRKFRPITDVKFGGQFKLCPKRVDSSPDDVTSVFSAGSGDELPGQPKSPYCEGINLLLGPVKNMSQQTFIIKIN